jgi:superfamily II DNA or RNA helicase
VDLFDEGLDVPGIEVVGMARPTKSLGKFLQMVGRGLRVIAGKEFMILIDHVGNVKHHGLPDNMRRWTLDRISRRAQRLNFTRICSNHMCNSPYDRALTACPWCNAESISSRAASGGTLKSMLEQVDGDLQMIDPEYIRQMEKQSQLEDPAKVAQRVAHAAGADAGVKAMRNQQARIETQKLLVQAIATWAGIMKHQYRYSDRQIHKKFYLYHHQTITEALGEPKEYMERTIMQLQDTENYY